MYASDFCNTIAMLRVCILNYGKGDRYTRHWLLAGFYTDLLFYIQLVVKMPMGIQRLHFTCGRPIAKELK